ncbi:hypothetical protein [Oceanobacter sp. 4_MG-2023]|nr:hypothetical protein [Oceanobacter sp. 4_MG-2023]MDP2549495.1 hypothetical protein [Oceanobacter sp. 4_MG-2023]
MFDMNGLAKDFIADLIDIINAKTKAGEEPEINLVFLVAYLYSVSTK